MKELFKKTTASIILSSIVAFVIGLILAVMPGISIQVMGIIVGTYIIVHGIVLIAITFAMNVFYIPFFGIMSGLLSVVLGVILIAMPNILPTIFTIALGIWIILSSVNIISVSLTIRKRYSNWPLLLLLGIVDLVAGMIVLFNPFASAISFVVLGGVIIMVHSVITIVDMCIIKKNVKEISQALESNFKELK